MLIPSIVKGEHSILGLGLGKLKIKIKFKWPKLVCILWSLMVPLPLMANCIGVVTAGGGDGFWGDVKKGAMTAAKELNVQVVVRGPADEVDEQAQSKIIKSMIAMGCKGLVLAPNSHARKLEVSQLKKEGILTVFIDRDIGGKRVSIIKTDNYQAGYLAGVEMANALLISPKRRVVILRMDKHVISTSRREEGFLKAIKDNKLELVYEGYIGTTISQARVNSFKILSKLNTFEGVFTPNESTSVSVLASLKQLGLADKVKHIGFDSHELMVKSVQQKNMYGFIVQNPYLMGYQGVKTVYAAMQGQAYEQSLSAEVVFVNNKNITHKKIQTLLGFIE